MREYDSSSPARPCLGAIWAQTDAGIIGRDGTMPWRAPEDLAHFKTVTVGKPVIMGRRTWESFPPRFRPLPERTNIVISSSMTGDSAAPLERDGALWVPSLDAALTLASNTPLTPNATQHPDSPHQQVDAWIIGGGSVYAEALSREDLPAFGRVEIIERTFFYCQEGNEITGDTYAPELAVEGFVAADEPARWRILGESAWEKSERGYLLDASGGKNPMYYSFQTLARL